ncbi:Mrp/NBP35 family ATP-binding protein [Leifsonia sp. Leaf264]|uniref:Mrp/NBP35 family ATP-binding protein n=1 Tax=Leifsonia sp. Leaf264 TaxID=1736314 RepID=UPI0006FAF861|nr:Mrp/NBP35 family ATP-binding protein [Leifsonia sp. Leaf264]KQO97810.1 sodium:proton antiporter [Leifsonia sp. Leaf264]
MPDTALDAVAAVLEAVGAVTDPELRRPLGELGMVRDVSVADGVASVGILLTIAGCPMAQRIERDVRSAAATVDGIRDVQVDVGVMTDEQRAGLVTLLRKGRPQAGSPFTAESLTRVIAVTSGKGGVGKSTVTANLAVALAARGLRVGLIDADVHGFSIPGLLGLIDDGRVIRPTRVDELMLPPIAHGVRVVSIGMFLKPGTEGSAVPWRGPMLHHTLEQFLTDVFFGDLDVLLIDMPPGTGDAAISVGHLLPHAEVLVVTTPQQAASDVAVRSGLLARQLGQRVIGVVETMSPSVLSDGSVFEPFGSGGGSAVADKLSALGDPAARIASIPFSSVLRTSGDAGLPVGIGHPDDPAARAFTDLADDLAIRPRGLSGRKLPLSVG